MYHLQTILSSLSQQLPTWQAIFPQQINDIFDLKKIFTEQTKRLSDENLRLSIGIMGQVKAGKSSFLNALLFQGKPILPEAATPKTANLTRISYGEVPLLQVEYYQPQEWAAICEAAAGPGEHTEARVGRDLLKMVQTHGLDVEMLLAQAVETIHAQNIDELMYRMNDYVGENGRYTAVVKSTQIQLPLEELKGFEVVDTPGMNDPVPSRTQKTHEYMRQCDVVFFLSRCSQFLDQADMDLLARQLPGNGVKRMVLVACQLDAVLLDDGYDRASLAETERNVTTRLGRRANSELEKLAQFREDRGQQNIANLLRSLKTPIFASTYAHAWARIHHKRWSEGLRHTHKELQAMAKDSWSGYQFNSADWLRLGNFSALEAAYHAARNDKKALLQAQREQLIPGTCSELQQRLQRLIDTVKERSTTLRDSDLKTIETHVRATEKRLDDIQTKLAEIIDKFIAKVHKESEKLHIDLRTDLRRAAQASAQLKTRTDTKEVENYRTVSTSRWYKPWSWGDTERVYYTTTESYEYLAVSDAIDKVVGYAEEVTAQLRREFERLINLSTLRTELKVGLLDTIDTRSGDFNPANFRAVFNGTLDRIILPKLQFDLGDVGNKISSQFSGQIEGNDKMNTLRATVQQTIMTLFEQLLSKFEAAVKTLCKELTTVRDSLGQQLADDLRAELEQLRKAFASKNEELQTYEHIVAFSQTSLKSLA